MQTLLKNIFSLAYGATTILARYANTILNDFRYRLGEHDAVLPLAVLGVISGLLTGIVISLFRLAIEAASHYSIESLADTPNNSIPFSLSALLKATTASATNTDRFEILNTALCFGLPLGGAILLGLVYQLLPKHLHYTGLSHVLVTLHKHNGRAPLANGLVQFFGGIVALASGQSGGREGPAVHLGAAVNSHLSNRLHLPHNSMRTLIACGAAAAIGASFNTPIAGVIFAMEVIIMEYTLIGFVPVILSAISATTLSQIIFGDARVFNVPDMSMSSHWEIPYLALLGFACGFAALLFMRIQLLTQKLQHWPVLIKFTLAGLLTGSLAVYLPGVLGIGYDSVNTALAGNSHWHWLLMLCLAKIMASAVSSGMGMPIGIIGPSLVIGASLGGCLGFFGAAWIPELSSDAGFYALLGMGGVMAALLNAPLAAIIAILELAHTPEALLPGIIVIVIATLCSDQIFGQDSAIATVLKSQGINLSTHPVTQALNRISLSAVCDRNIEKIDPVVSAQQLELIAQDEPRAVVLQRDTDSYYLITRKEFLQWYEALSMEERHNIRTVDHLLESLKQADIPVQSLQQIAIESTVTEAREALHNDQCDGLYVIDHYGPMRGILRKSTLEKLIASW